MTMPKPHKLIFIFNAIILLICLLFGYRYFVMSSRLVGNSVVYITQDPDRRAFPISLDSVLDGIAIFDGYRIAFEHRTSATLRNGSRNIDASLSFTNHTYFLLQNYFFLHGGGWPESFNNSNVIVLSENAAWELFGNTDVVSMHAQIGEQFFEISGVIGQDSLDEPGFAWVPYNHHNSGVRNITGIYIEGVNYRTLERLVLAVHFADTIELNLANLRFVDLDQYAYNILVKFNLFAMVIAVFGILFFMVRLFYALEPTAFSMPQSIIYGLLTVFSVLAFVLLWQNTGPNLAPSADAFGVRTFIDTLNNRNTFEGISNLSHIHYELHEFNRLSAFPLIIGMFAFVNIAGIGAYDTFVKHKEYAEKRGPAPSATVLVYILKRLLQLIPTFIIMTFIVFYVNLFIPTEGRAYFPPDAFVMYLRYITAILQGDFGWTWAMGNFAPLLPILMDAYLQTLILVLGAMILSGFFGVVLGIFAAIKRNRWTDHIIMVLTLFASSIPVFYLALLLALLFILHLGIFSIMPDGTWRMMVLPIATLTLPSLAFIARTTRTSMLEVLNMPCITAAHARGLPERKVILHAISNMRIPAITAISLRTAELFMGTVLVEAIFSINGLGRLVLQAINGRDIHMLMGSIIFLSLTFTIINLLVDILYVIVDPRTRKSFK